MSRSKRGKLLGDESWEISKVSSILFNAEEGKCAAQPFPSCLPQELLDGWMLSCLWEGFGDFKGLTLPSHRAALGWWCSNKLSLWGV